MDWKGILTYLLVLAILAAVIISFVQWGVSL